MTSGRALRPPGTSRSAQESDQMTVPENLQYTAEHEWVAIEGTVASVGITDFAQQALGDVVYVSVPAAGETVTAGEPCGEVESTKSVSDLYSPVDGEVIEANPEIEDDPGLVNTDPYGAGWLLRIRVASGAEPAGLLTAEEYDALTKEAE
jgi:glycine cleavage system H protein